jgi:hypothetical protein
LNARVRSGDKQKTENHIAMKKQRVKRNKNQRRQGDVLVTAVPLAQIKGKKQPKGQITVAEGEATGHHHTVDVGAAGVDAADWWKDEDNGLQYVTVTEKSPLKHQEHGPVTFVPQKANQVRIQSYYDPVAIRQVAD